MAIKNKMVLEGLDPNLLEWVDSVHCCTFVLKLVGMWYLKADLFWTLFTFLSFVIIAAHQMHLRLTVVRKTQRRQMMIALAANHLSATDLSISPWHPSMDRPSLVINGPGLCTVLCMHGRMSVFLTGRTAGRNVQSHQSFTPESFEGKLETHKKADY